MRYFLLLSLMILATAGQALAGSEVEPSGTEILSGAVCHPVSHTEIDVLDGQTEPVLRFDFATHPGLPVNLEETGFSASLFVARHIQTSPTKKVLVGQNGERITVYVHRDGEATHLSGTFELDELGTAAIFPYLKDLGIESEDDESTCVDGVILSGLFSPAANDRQKRALEQIGPIQYGLWAQDIPLTWDETVRAE